MPRAKSSKAAVKDAGVPIERLTVMVPGDVRAALRMKASNDRKDMGDVLTEILRRVLTVELKHLAAMRRELIG